MKASQYIKARIAKGIAKGTAEEEALALVADGLVDDVGLTLPKASVLLQAVLDAGMEESAARALVSSQVAAGKVADDLGGEPQTVEDAAARLEAARAELEATTAAANTEAAASVLEPETAKSDAEMDKGTETEAASTEGAQKPIAEVVAEAIEEAIKPLIADLVSVRKGLATVLESQTAVQKGIGQVTRPTGVAASGETRAHPGEVASQESGVSKSRELTTDERSALMAKGRELGLLTDPNVQALRGAFMGACQYGTTEDVRKYAELLKIQIND